MQNEMIHKGRQADAIEITPEMVLAGAWALHSVAGDLIGHLSLERAGEFAVEVYEAMVKKVPQIHR